MVFPRRRDSIEDPLRPQERRHEEDGRRSREQTLENADNFEDRTDFDSKLEG